ncbi:putative ribonuclease H-like domain-containing protein [Tanacetum coccineum]
MSGFWCSWLEIAVQGARNMGFQMSSTCDNGTEFKNKVMDDFWKEKGIRREYSIARTPQQNDVAERRNRTLIEAARTMLADSKLPTTFWAEACFYCFAMYKMV